MTTPPTTDLDEARALRHQLADQLAEAGHIRSPAVDAALRAVPRHAFAPEVPIQKAYANDIVATRHGDDGSIISSISAPWLQALRRRDHTSHTEIISCGGAALRDVPRNPMARGGCGVKNRRMHEVELSDGIITLSPLRLDDVEAHLTGEDELLARYLNGGPGTREGVEAYFRHCREQWAIAGPLRAFGIRAGADKTLAGTIDLRFEGEGLTSGQVNVAYGLYPSWRGHGLATRAVVLVSQYAASESGQEAVIQVNPDNSASAAVAQRAGFAPSKQTQSQDGTRLDWYVRDLRIDPQ
ncbi:GNAT family N-acetyltransferase [Streptomyces sp. LN499]|uniref:GNAT family N-acetyltransferase n=1 Tax=Streptomyces sp. LN499 TaxID=3112977 RepID=UPI0037150613